MDKVALGISVLSGEFKAVTPGKGVGARETYESGATGDITAGLGAMLREAVEKTRATGKTVALALAHPRMIDQIVEVPPVKGWKLTRLLQRRAQTSKAFVGEAAWSYQTAMPTKRGPAALLHLCPKAAVDALVKSCGEAQLQLLRVLPTTAILVNHLKTLPIPKDELAVLAAETGTMTTIVVGRKDGKLCVGRVVSSNWKTEPDRVGIDLTRSIGFAEQQSGLTVNSVWLFGAAANGQLARMEELLKLPVKLSPVEYSPFYWAEQAASLPEQEDGNLISLESQLAPQRKRFLTLTGVLLCILAVVAAVAVGVIEMTRHREVQTITSLKGKIADLRLQQQDLQQGLGELKQMKAMTQVVSGEPLPPVPAWLLGYLSEAAPTGLVLTQFRIARTNDFWSVNLAGSAEPGTNQTVAFRAAYASLTNSLAGGPFHLAVSRSIIGTAGEIARALAGTKEPPPESEEVEKDPNSFILEGVMR